MTDERFSARHGFRKTHEVDITIRHDAPNEFRGVLVDLAYECGYRPKSLRNLVCRVLRRRPDPNNWSEYPNVDREIRDLLDDCEWHRVYDVVEVLSTEMAASPISFAVERFQSELNLYFAETGIGWKLVDGHIEVRAPEALQRTLETAEKTLDSASLPTARQELKEGLGDLSRRPDPDVSGAIQHSVAALECVAREVAGDPKATLGEIIKRGSLQIPKPLDDSVAKAWAFASEYARHIREGRTSTYKEAELVVGVCATLCTYLAKKNDSGTE